MTDGEVGSTVSRDGTRIAWVRSGSGPPIVLVHGATADHTAWRTAAPLLAPTHTLFAIDRRGRGSSGDHLPYAIAREYEDVAAVVDAISASEGRPVDVVGHSFGGRVGLGAALLTSNLRRLVVYEGAPAPGGRSFHGDQVMARLEALAAADDRERLLAYFLAEVVGMPPADLEAYRTSPTWPTRVADAPTLVREMWAEAGRGCRPRALRGDPDPGPPDRRWRERPAVHGRHVGARSAPGQRAGRGDPGRAARGPPHPPRSVRGRGPRVPGGGLTIRA